MLVNHAGTAWTAVLEAAVIDSIRAMSSPPTSRMCRAQALYPTGVRTESLQKVAAALGWGDLGALARKLDPGANVRWAALPEVR